MVAGRGGVRATCEAPRKHPGSGGARMWAVRSPAVSWLPLRWARRASCAACWPFSVAHTRTAPGATARTRTANAQLWRIDAHDTAAAVADNCAVGVLPRSSPTGCNAHAPCQRCRRAPSHNDSDAATQRCPCRLNPCTAQRSPTATPDSHRTIGTAAMIGRGALHLPKNLSWPTPPPASIHAMTDLFASAPPALDGIHIGIGGWVYAPWRAGMF